MNSKIHITRKAIKHLYLRIDRDGKLQVSAPKRMPTAEIMAFIAQKQAWISKKQQQRGQQTLNHPNHLALFGQDYPIQRQAHSHNRLWFAENTCYIGLKPADAARHETLAKKCIIEYYRVQLLPVLMHFVAHYQPIIGVKPAEIRTKNMKSKWGSCNTQAKRLWFNVQLARFPEKMIEYVVVHEMVHLLEASHNQRFYQLVAAAMPDWQSYHTALKQAL